MCGLRKLTLEKAVGRLVGDQSLRLTGRDGGLAHAAHLEPLVSKCVDLHVM